MCTRFACPGGIFGTLFWPVLTVSPVFDVLLAVCITENTLVNLRLSWRALRG